MRTYWYCKVSVKGLDTEYSYISDSGEISVGAYVEVPFGPDNELRIGMVRSCGEFSAEDAPWPVDRTKHVMRIASAAEYEDQPAVQPGFRADESEVPESELEAVGMAVQGEDWEAVFEWAARRQDSADPAVMRKVVECYELCVEQGIPAAAVNLGTLYYTGHHVGQDYGRAFELYKIGADAGDCRGICNCGYCFYYGRHAETDYAEAFRYFSLGALLFDDANCLYKLGDMFLHGLGTEQNEGYAFRMYMRSLARCHENEKEGSCIADVQLRVGECLLHGTGTAKDIDEAHVALSFALLNYYKRQKAGEGVAWLIAKAKKLIAEAQDLLDGARDDVSPVEIETEQVQ